MGPQEGKSMVKLSGLQHPWKEICTLYFDGYTIRERDLRTAFQIQAMRKSCLWAAFLSFHPLKEMEPLRKDFLW